MYVLAILPFFFQGLAIGVDELYFHHKRGLPKWERIGHPLDTLSVLICMYMVLCIPFSQLTLKIYIALSVFSCFFVTKDEFVHKHYCPASENWLHALLFILHPITLTMAGLIWAALSDGTSAWLKNWLNNLSFLKTFLIVQAVLMTLFLFYQIIFWNFLWKEKIAVKH